MLTYKGTDKKMQCKNGFQYELGKEYVDDGAIRCGDKGFHSCKAPLDVFSYFAPATSRYFTCEAGGTIDESDEDSKIASSKLTLKAELTIPALVKAHIEYVKARTTTEHTDPKRATAGDRGAATAGDWGAATAGDRGAATAGAWGAATAGALGAATAGDRGAATAGDRGAATARGSVTVGENGSGLVRGNNVKIRGKIGAVLVIVEENDNDYEIKWWKAVVVDGEIVKADTWYSLRNGELVEVEE